MEHVLRDLSVADAPALAELHVQTFRETHGGGPSVSVRLQQWTDLLGAAHGSRFAVGLEAPDARLVGFAAGCPHDGGVPGYQGELNKIYLLREVQRQGLGRRLVLAVAERFLARGIPSMLLFGDARSPANGFYEHLGAQRLLSPAGEFHGGYGWLDLEVLVARGRRQAP